MIGCTRHPSLAAGWQCAECGRYLCEDCAALDRMGKAPLTRCGHCGGLVRHVLAFRDVEPYWRAALPTLRAMATFEGLVQILVLALVMWLFSLALLLGPVLQIALVLAYYFVVVRHAGIGGRGLPEPDLEHVGGGTGAALRFVVGSFWLWAPLLLYLTERELILDFLLGTDTSLRDPYVVGWLCFCLIMFPAVVMVASVADSISTIFSPLTAVRLVRELGLQYLGAVAVWTAALAVHACVVVLLGQTLDRVFVPFIAPVLGYMLWLVFPVVSAFVLGRVLYEHGETLGLLVPEEKLVPQVPGAKARGTWQRAEDRNPDDELPVDLDLTLSEGEPLGALDPPTSLREALESHDAEAALRAYREMIRCTAGMQVFLAPELEMRLAAVLESAGDTEAAAQAWSRAASQDLSGPFAADAILGLARLLGRLGKHERSQDLLEQLRSRFPESPAARDAASLMGGQ